jgi:hypothetical protein
MPAKVKLLLVVLLTALLLTALYRHSPWLNGPSYWKWPWRSVPALRFYQAMLLAGAPLLIAATLTRLRVGVSIAHLMISMLAMQITASVMSQSPASFRGIIYTVESPTNLSYFADADRSLDIPTRQLLGNFPAYMPQFHMHSQEKPPGPILFFRVILAAFGPSDRTALIAGLIIGALATLTVPATCLLIKTLTGDDGDNEDCAALFGCCFIAFAPGLILHLPQMDQLYPIISCAMIICWWNALKEDGYRWAVGFGLVLAGACFVVYHFLVLGAFLAAITIAHRVFMPGRSSVEIVRRIMAAMAGFVVVYLLLYVFAGFNPVATFLQALHNQAEHLSHLHRPYPKTIWDDLVDFALGSGWIGCLLAIFFVGFTERSRARWILALLCIGQLLLVAASGLLLTETARTWCFLLPLLAIPVGLELASWGRWQRFCAVAAMWVILCGVGQNLKFIFKPAEQSAALSQSLPPAP